MLCTRKKLKHFCIMLIIGMLFFQSIFLSCAYAGAAGYNSANSTSKIDAVLVLDSSNSMNYSDTKKISIEAVKMFIDMCSVKGDKVGIIAYNDSIIGEKQLMEIKDVQDKQSLKDIASGFPRKGSTDIGLAMKKAVEMLDRNGSSSHKPMIIILSDGVTDLKKSDRTVEQSRADKKEALQISEYKGYPIYTIGLNADGSVDQGELKSIAEATKAKSFVTDTAENLPQILSEIFADHLKLKIVSPGYFNGTGDFLDIKVSIPDSNVVEANISLLSQNPLEVKLFDNEGNEKNMSADNIKYTVSDKYSMIKILSPKQGDWLLKVKGISGDKIKVNLIFNYDIDVAMELTPNSGLKAEDKIDINTYMASGGQKLTDSQLYKSSNGTLIIKNLKDGSQKEISLKNDGDHFSGTYAFADSGEYELKTKIETSSFLKESQTVTLSIEEKPVLVVWTKPFIFSGIGLLLLLIGIIAAFPAIKRANKILPGQMMLEIKDENTGKLAPPQYKRLDLHKGRVTLHQLLQLLPEYKETEKISFTAGKSDRLVMKNNASCTIQKSGRIIDASKGYEIKANDRIIITLTNTSKSIILEYYI